MAKRVSPKEKARLKARQAAAKKVKKEWWAEREVKMQAGSMKAAGKQGVAIAEESHARGGQEYARDHFRMAQGKADEAKEKGDSSSEAYWRDVARKALARTKARGKEKLKAKGEVKKRKAQRAAYTKQHHIAVNKQ